MTAIGMASSRLSASVWSAASRIQSRSAPAENVPPAPRTNTTRTPSAGVQGLEGLAQRADQLGVEGVLLARRG